MVNMSMYDLHGQSVPYHFSLVKQVEYGRGEGPTRASAREAAAQQAVDALHQDGYY